MLQNDDGWTRRRALIGNMRIDIAFRRTSPVRHGFTLIETVAVLVISGTLLSIAVPRLAGLRDAAAVRGAMSDLGSVFTLARQTAVTRRATVAIVIDTTAGEVILRSQGQTFLRHGLQTSYGVRVSSNRDSAVYDPRGLAYGLSNLSISVRRGNFSDTLTMSRLGRVRW
jgi:prepilin-type N-terminal cleavage/methylation domain-containing protein